jgi:hypothetical protein
MKLRISFLLILAVVLNGCSGRSQIVATFWGHNISAEDLRMTQMDGESLSINKNHFAESQRVLRCYSMIREETLSYYVKKDNIVINQDELDWWIDKYCDSMGFDESKLREAETNALIELEIMLLYLVDPEKAKEKFDTNPISQFPELWESIKKRSKNKTVESVNTSIDLIKNGDIKHYLFSYQVSYVCQLQIMLDKIENVFEVDYKNLNWVDFSDMQVSRYNKYLYDEIQKNKNIIFYDTKLKDEILDYILSNR